MEVFFKYNSCTNEKEVKIDSEIIGESDELLKIIKGNIQKWIVDFVPKLLEEINQKKFKLVFSGLPDDFDKISAEVNKYNDKGYNIELKYDKEKERVNIEEKTSKTVSLKKGEKVELTKGNLSFKSIIVGLGWDTNKYIGKHDFDMDAAAFLLGENGKVHNESDFIFYNNLEHESKAVRHFGDELRGGSNGDDEQICINLSKIPENINKIAFTVTINEGKERGQNFGQVSNAYIRVIDEDTTKEIIRYDLREGFSIETAVVVGEIYRYKGDWKFNAIGSGFQGGLAALCNNFGVKLDDENDSHKAKNESTEQKDTKDNESFEDEYVKQANNNESKSKDYNGMKIFLKYNPYNNEKEVKINEEVIDEKGSFLEKLKGRLQEWVADLIPKLEEEVNQRNFLLTFYGRECDYEDVFAEINKYNKKGYNIELEFIEAKQANDIKVKIENIFEKIQNGKIEELKTPEIKNRFNKAMNSEAEVGVIATMSSGKSTIINAILEKELMPSKNEACTATICRIKDYDEMKGDGFRVRAKDKDDKIIQDWTEATLEKITAINDIGDNVSVIEIEGDIPGISSEHLNLILIDTPGPNNSQNAKHTEHTLNFIKNSTLKPMVLYILNATQFAVNDDKSLLTQISEAMKQGGNQSKDRFLFIVNKIDSFDPEKEDVEHLLESVTKYIESFGIEKPNIFPVSAELAKVIRLKRKGEQLTKNQAKTLYGHITFLPDEDGKNSMDMIKLSSLSKNSKNKLSKKAARFLKEGEKEKAAEYYSGIPCIEEAVNEYLKKYAFPSKVTEAVECFSNQVKNEIRKDLLEKSLRDDEGKREKILSMLKNIEEALGKQKGIGHYKEGINKMKIDFGVIDKLDKKIELSFFKLTDLFSESKVKRNRAEEILNNASKEISNITVEIKTDAAAGIRDNIKVEGEKLVNDYKKYIEDLIEEQEIGKKDYSSELSQIFTVDIPVSNSLIKDNIYEEKEVVDKKYVSDSKWYNPFSWGKGHYENIYETVEYVDMPVIYRENIEPIRKQLDRNVENVREELEEDITALREVFIERIDKFENKLREKLKNMEEQTKNKETIEKAIEENKEKIEWVKAIEKEIEKILTI